MEEHVSGLARLKLEVVDRADRALRRVYKSEVVVVEVAADTIRGEPARDGPIRGGVTEILDGGQAVVDDGRAHLDDHAVDPERGAEIPLVPVAAFLPVRRTGQGPARVVVAIAEQGTVALTRTGTDRATPLHRPQGDVVADGLHLDLRQGRAVVDLFGNETDVLHRGVTECILGLQVLTCCRSRIESTERVFDDSCVVRRSGTTHPGELEDVFRRSRAFAVVDEEAEVAERHRICGVGKGQRDLRGIHHPPQVDFDPPVIEHVRRRWLPVGIGAAVDQIVHRRFVGEASHTTRDEVPGLLYGMQELRRVAHGVDHLVDTVQRDAAVIVLHQHTCGRRPGRPSVRFIEAQHVRRGGVAEGSHGKQEQQAVLNGGRRDSGHAYVLRWRHRETDDFC